MFLLDLEQMLACQLDRGWVSYRQQLVFIFDNASIHKTEAVRGFFEK